MMPPYDTVPAAFARDLERENARLREALRSAFELASMVTASKQNVGHPMLRAAARVTEALAANQPRTDT